MDFNSYLFMAGAFLGTLFLGIFLFLMILGLYYTVRERLDQ